MPLGDQPWRRSDHIAPSKHWLFLPVWGLAAAWLVRLLYQLVLGGGRGGCCEVTPLGPFGSPGPVVGPFGAPSTRSWRLTWRRAAP